MENQKRRPPRKKRIPPVTRLGLLLVSALLLFNGYTLAKYFMEKDSEQLYVAKSFYFESDLLNLGGTNTHTLSDGETSFTFHLMNYPDSLRTSEVDISYEILVDDNPFVIPENAAFDGTLGRDEKVETVTVTGLTPGNHTVTVTATSPYIKTLGAKITVGNVDATVTHSVSDGKDNPVCYLTVTVGDYGTNGVNLTITPPSGVTLDPNQSIPTKFPSNSEYKFTYFKNTISTVYTDTNFTVNTTN